jgi:hypothetical protein
MIWYLSILSGVAATANSKRPLKLSWGKKRAEGGPSVSTGGVTSGGVVHAGMHCLPCFAPHSINFDQCISPINRRIGIFGYSTRIHATTTW